MFSEGIQQTSKATRKPGTKWCLEFSYLGKIVELLQFSCISHVCGCTYVCAHVCLCVRACMCPCAHVFMHACACVYMHVSPVCHVNVCPCVYVACMCAPCACMCGCMRVPICVCMHVPPCTPTRTLGWTPWPFLLPFSFSPTHLLLFWLKFTD